MTEDKSVIPEIEASLKPEVDKAGEIVQDSDEILAAMIALFVKEGISGEAVISYLVVTLGVTPDKAEASYAQVYNAGNLS